MGTRPIIREVDPHWHRVHRALMDKIAYLERDIMMIHEDYIELELRNMCLLAVIRRQAERDTLERVNRAAKAVNDG